MKIKKIKKSEILIKNLIVLIYSFIILITLSTQYIGSTDTGSFTSPSKYFAGLYSAKIRSSHSYLWGFINAPFVALFHSFIGFKIMNLIILAAIIFSVYYISGKSKKALFLILLSPIIWYMAPWINSIQISSLFFLWSYYFMSQYEKLNKIQNLFYSGIFFGLSLAFWHAIFFFGISFIILFFYDKKTIHLFYYFLAISMGLIPLLTLDYFLFGFPFHSLIKNIGGTFSNFLGLAFHKGYGPQKTIFAYIALFLVIPLYFWKFFKKDLFKKNYRTMIFLTTSLIIIAKNPQIRYLFLIIPIMILNLITILNKKQFRRLIIFSAIVSLIVLIPYEIQIKYSTNGKEFRTFLQNFPNLEISSINNSSLIIYDLDQISKEYPNETFIVGNEPDDYQLLADLYWGKDVREFVSIQDYNLYLQNSSTLIEREFRSGPKNIYGRREIWIKGGIGKPLNDPTDYASIKYAISLDENLSLDGFGLIKRYDYLSLYKKS